MESTWEIPIPADAKLGKVTEAGSYLSEVSKIPEITKAKNGGDQMVFTFRVLEGKYKDEEGQLYCSMKPKAWWKITNVLDVLGVPYSTEGGTLKMDPVQAVGKQVLAVWEKSSFGNKSRVKINDVVPVGTKSEALVQ